VVVAEDGGAATAVVVAVVQQQHRGAKNDSGGGCVSHETPGQHSAHAAWGGRKRTSHSNQERTRKRLRDTTIGLRLRPNSSKN
jgi:hypothetical protein